MTSWIQVCQARVGGTEGWFFQDPPDSSGVIPSPMPVAGSLILCGSGVRSRITCAGPSSPSQASPKGLAGTSAGSGEDK